MENERDMSSLTVGESATVSAFSSSCSLYRRFVDLGFVPGTRVECVGKSPMGDPVAYRVRGKCIAVRKTDAKGILIV